MCITCGTFLILDEGALVSHGSLNSGPWLTQFEAQIYLQLY